ncbi:4Fe-4S dicluster domain-containing protein [Candidatus Methanoperedens nitratireducens]|uniref:4Fe-4S dicluster domain-containing protein n=1 Tax=Candidatus Methanoperedens nitratireducens TaxID=1392998 RepID=UPI0012FF463E
MKCVRCINICPSNCLDIDNGMSCVRFEGRSALKMDKEKCTECNMCMEVCPIGDLALSVYDCSNCIVCKNRPGCIDTPSTDRASFLNSINSITHFIVSKIYFSIRYT